jgi:hypothetical protein
MLFTADIGVGVVVKLVTAAEFEPSSDSSMFKTLTFYHRRHCNIVVYLNAGRCENPECRNITEYAGISRNIAIFSRNIPEHHNFPMVAMRLLILKHGRLATYFITKVMDLSHFDGK